MKNNIFKYCHGFPGKVIPVKGKFKILYVGFIGLLLSFYNKPTIPYSHETVDPEIFKETPDESGIHTWWHWIDGNITKEGILKDLEAMSNQGITQATILNVGLFNKQFFGLDNIQFNSPEWYKMFQFALDKADSLNLKIGVHNCDGWSTSGGPWITPEYSMKEITWNSCQVIGGKHIKQKLEKPYSCNGFYRDIAILAIKSDKPTNSFVQAKPGIKINSKKLTNHISDGCPVGSIAVKKKDTVSIDFYDEFESVKIAIHPRKSFVWGSIDDIDNSIISFTLESEISDSKYRELDHFITRGFNKTQIIDIPRIKTRSFRLIIDSIENTESFFIGELEFLQEDESPSYTTDIPWHQAKSASVQGSSKTNYYEHDGYRSHPIPFENIIDLTDKFNESGMLEWDVPAGKWKVIRFGYTTTGTTSRPATASGTGLECDKMDTTALNWHYNHFPAKLVEQAGDYTGNTFKFLLLDSWECYFQNWTETLPEEFEKLNGYSLRQWIPVLCGEVVQSSISTESFLYDFRRTIAELIENNYYKHYADLCHQDSLELHGEVIYGGTKLPPVDVLKAYSYTDMPMYEFWARPDKDMLYRKTKLPEYLNHFASSAGLFYEKPVIGSEAYTGYATYSASPWNLKPYGDVAFCSGINQMILHSYVHQPSAQKPGLTLQNFGHSFNRHNTCWNKISGWLNFQSRIQYILQNSTEANDILYYVGDALPQINGNAMPIPNGYKYSICNFDILKNKLYVENQKIRSDQGASFSILVLPDQEGINYSTLIRLEELLKEGARIYGRKPLYLNSLSDQKTYFDDFKKLTDKIWGKGFPDEAEIVHYGKGEIYHDMPLSEVFNIIELPADFEANAYDSTHFIFTHRQSRSAEIYYVANQLNQPVLAKCTFREKGNSIEIWNPLTGEITSEIDSVLDYSSTHITVKFNPFESLFFIFRKEAELYQYPATPKDLAIYVISEYNGTIEFSPEYDDNIKPVKIKKLLPLSEFENPEIKYFAGKAKYSIEFPFSYSIDSTKDWFINIGNLNTTASVSLNEHKLEDVWSPLQELSVNHILKQGKNSLEIIVDIPYRNRFIGDFILFGDVKSLWTTCQIRNYIDEHSPLKPSGLVAPVKIIAKTK